MNGRVARQRRAAERAALGVAQRDQLDASEAEARNLVLATAAVGALSPAGVRNTSSRVALRLELLAEGVAAGALERCPHLLTGTSPRVVFTSLSKPALYCGPGCAPPEPGVDVCDFCSATSPHLFAGVTSMENVFVFYSVCLTCAREAVGP